MKIEIYPIASDIEGPDYDDKNRYEKEGTNHRDI